MHWPGHRFAIAFFAAVIAIWMAAMVFVMRQAALPPEAAGPMLAVFEPSTPADVIFAKLTRAEARPLRPAAFGFIWIVAGDEPGLAGRLMRQGAIGAYRELPISAKVANLLAP
jgi:hypothetical protein